MFVNSVTDLFYVLQILSKEQELKGTKSKLQQAAE